MIDTVPDESNPASYGVKLANDKLVPNEREMIEILTIVNSTLKCNA